MIAATAAKKISFGNVRQAKVAALWYESDDDIIHHDA